MLEALWEILNQVQDDVWENGEICLKEAIQCSNLRRAVGQGLYTTFDLEGVAQQRA